MEQLKVIDLFSGVGGLSYGFARHSGFKIIAANEILKDMAIAYSKNHPDVRMYNEDIKDFNAKRLEEDLNIKSSEIDILVGGPPCQSFSTVGKRLTDDPRGKLFQEYYRVLKELKPSFFVFENVKGLLSMKGGELLETIVSLFESLGYQVKYKVLNAADYGAPQIRERVIITGTKLGKEFKYPEPTHYNPEEGPTLFSTSMKPYLTLKDAIGDLPFIKSNDESYKYSSDPKNDFQQRMRNNAPKELQDHNSPNNNPQMVKLMKALPDGGTPQDVPKNLRPQSGYKNTYCRLWWNRPCTTLTRNLGTPSSSRCIHPKAARPLTTREGARIQCFPDNYKFYGSRGAKNLQIGNAVPTLLSEALVASIFDHFRE